MPIRRGIRGDPAQPPADPEPTMPRTLAATALLLRLAAPSRLDAGAADEPKPFPVTIRVDASRRHKLRGQTI